MTVDKEILGDFLNDNVVVTLKNNFRKFGKIVKTTDNFIELLLYDDGKEIINIDDIKGVKKDKKVIGNGRGK